MRNSLKSNRKHKRKESRRLPASFFAAPPFTPAPAAPPAKPNHCDRLGRPLTIGDVVVGCDDEEIFLATVEALTDQDEVHIVKTYWGTIEHDAGPNRWQAIFSGSDLLLAAPCNKLRAARIRREKSMKAFGFVEGVPF